MKRIKKNIFGFIIGALLFTGISAYALNKIYATDVDIDTTNISELNSGSTLKDALDGLYKKANSTDCPSGYKCFTKKSTPEVGDYIKMTPKSTSYTTDTSKTGYTSTQTINPSELDTWRVIKVNSDGTIEVVSENISSTAVYFKGQTGYKNLIGYLNELANQYQNTKYTIKARHMGYNGQTEYLTDTANTVDSTATTAPWTCSTGGSCSPVESQGGGDTLYTNDTDLVKNAIGTLVASPKGGSASYYWLASRYYDYNSSSRWYYSGRIISRSGSFSSYGDLYGYNSGVRTYSSSYRLRPILTLKSGISYTAALGTSDDPFVLS